GGDGLVEVGLRAERNLIHRFFSRGIDDRGGLLDDRVDPGAIDVELHAIDHRKPLNLRGLGGRTVSVRQASLHESPGVWNPPYAGGRCAACAEYRGWDARGARYRKVTLSPCGRGSFRKAKRGEGFVSADR